MEKNAENKSGWFSDDDGDEKITLPEGGESIEDVCKKLFGEDIPVMERTMEEEVEGAVQTFKEIINNREKE